MHIKKRLSELLTDFIEQYVNSLSAGVCTEDQCGIAFFTSKDEFMFFAVERNSSIERNPKQLVPAHMSPVVAQAIFIRTPGTFRFTTAESNSAAPQKITLSDPITIQLSANNGETQLWMLSLDSVAREEDDAWYQAFRADPSTLQALPPAKQGVSQTLH